MDISIQFLQQYWWCLVSLLGALLVMLLFVQGGQTFIFQLSNRKDNNRKLIVNTFGRKWEFTFTTLVTFGGAFFASFPKFYSVSFGGATYVWLALLISMVIQAVAYEFRSKENNLLGTNTYDWFLTINGFLAPLLLGTAVGTFFFGADFIFRPMYLLLPSHQFVMSSWNSSWHGLEAVADYRNLLLGLSVLFLARTSALLYMINTVSDDDLIHKSRKSLKYNGLLFLIFFVSFIVCLLTASGVSEMYEAQQETRLGVSYMVQRDYIYLNNFISLPIISALFIIGVVMVLAGIAKGAFTESISGIWYSSIGTVLVAFSLFVISAWNGTAYYRSLSSPEFSLTMSNSSSSMMTLKVMMYVSFVIPIVLAYICWAWRKINKTKIDSKEVDNFEAY